MLFAKYETLHGRMISDRRSYLAEDREQKTFDYYFLVGVLKDIPTPLVKYPVDVICCVGPFVFGVEVFFDVLRGVGLP